MEITCPSCGDVSRQLAIIHKKTILSWQVSYNRLCIASDGGCKFCRWLKDYEHMWRDVLEDETLELKVCLFDHKSSRDPELEQILIEAPNGIRCILYVYTYDGGSDSDVGIH